MADTKLTDIVPEATALAGTEATYAVQGGVPKRLLASTIKEYVSQSPVFTGPITSSGAFITTSSPMAGTTIDVTKSDNTYNATGPATFSFSATPATGTTFGVTVTADGTDRVLEFPASFSALRGTTITSATFPANSVIDIVFKRTATGYRIFNDPMTPAQVNAAQGLAPVATSGSASDLTAGTLPVARGGTGTASPGLVQGSNVTITGTWPNQTIASTGGGAGTDVDGSIKLWLRSAAASVPEGWAEVTTVADYEELMFIIRDSTAPTYVSSAIDATGLVLTDTYNEPLSATVTTTTGRAITMSGGACTLSSPVVTGSTVAWTISREIDEDETCSANSYTQPGTGIKDSAGNYAATWDDADGSEVANNSEVPAAGAAAWAYSLQDADVTGSFIIATDNLRNTPVTLPAGNVTKLAAWKVVNNSHNWRIGLYDNSRNLIIQATIVPTGTGWNEVSVTPTAVSAGSYIVAVNGVTSSDTIGYSTTISTRATKTATYNPLPDPLPANDSSNTGAFATRVYVE